jgi:hypothetical protein
LRIEGEPGQRSAAKLLSKDEAHRIAANIAKLPELLGEPKRANRLLQFRAGGVRLGEGGVF